MEQIKKAWVLKNANTTSDQSHNIMLIKEIISICNMPQIVNYMHNDCVDTTVLFMSSQLCKSYHYKTHSLT
jgi:hypothetical protein